MPPVLEIFCYRKKMVFNLIFVTGGQGSGKSTLMKKLVKQGVMCIDLDDYMSDLLDEIKEHYEVDSHHIRKLFRLMIEPRIRCDVLDCMSNHLVVLGMLDYRTTNDHVDFIPIIEDWVERWLFNNKGFNSLFETTGYYINIPHWKNMKRWLKREKLPGNKVDGKKVVDLLLDWEEIEQGAIQNDFFAGSAEEIEEMILKRCTPHDKEEKKWIDYEANYKSMLRYDYNNRLDDLKNVLPDRFRIYI